MPASSRRCLSLGTLLALVTLTIQVDITMIGFVPPQTTEHCPNILPGQCCRSLGLVSGAAEVRIEHLLPFYLAAVWDQRMPPMNLNTQFAGSQGCNGRPTETRLGPSNWYFSPYTAQYQSQGSFPYGVHGASYIILPTSVPLDPTASILQEAQGGRAFVWGGGRWLAGLGMSSSRLVPRAPARRVIVSALRGTYYWTTPPRWTWPTFVMVNGTEFTDGGSGSLVYKSATGKVLDLKDVAH